MACSQVRWQVPPIWSAVPISAHDGTVGQAGTSDGSRSARIVSGIRTVGTTPDPVRYTYATGPRSRPQPTATGPGQPAIPHANTRYRKRFRSSDSI